MQIENKKARCNTAGFLLITLLRLSHINGIEPALALLHIEYDAVAFANGTGKPRGVNEDLLTAFIGDEAESFHFVEELYCTCLHSVVI